MRFLTADQKQQCVNVCKEPRQIASNDAPFLSRVITGDESWIYGYDPKTKKKSPNGKWRAKSRSCSSFPLSSRGLFTRNSSWQVKQPIPHTAVTFGWVKMCEDFVPNSGDKRTGCCLMTTHHITLPFSPGNFWPNITRLRPTPYFSLFTRLKIRGGHFGAIEVIEVESQAVLKTLTEHVV
jgi:hypothetical protein